MPSRLSLALLVAVAVAVGSAAVRLLARELDTLHARLDEARRDVARLLREKPAQVDVPKAPDVARLQREILGPSIQVNVPGGVGGGTILSSEGGRTWAITAWHVVRNAEGPVEVKLYDSGGSPAETVDADLVVWDEAKDLALLRLREARSARPARLASRESLRAVRVFTPLYAVGCPLGHDPLPTRGEVATLAKDVAGERFWMMNAPTIFGNSGGGIFHGETRELIGVSVMICTYDGAVSTPVPHLGILAPLEAVYDWLDAAGYGHAYDPSSSMEACEADRNVPSGRSDPVGRAVSTPDVRPAALERTK